MSFILLGVNVRRRIESPHFYTALSNNSIEELLLET